MGMNADLLVLVKFDKRIAKYLDYSEDYYEGVKEGSFILSTIHCCATNDSSRELAECFGIDPWNFSQHIFFSSPEKVNWKLLRDVISRTESNVDDIMEGIQLFIQKDFMFIYRPQG